MRRLEPAQMERLYFGRNIGDTAFVSDTAWASFVRDVVTPAFPEGASVWSTDGWWRAPDGITTPEKGFVIELLHPASADVEARVRRVIDIYKTRFAQISVLRVVTDVRASF